MVQVQRTVEHLGGSAQYIRSCGRDAAHMVVMVHAQAAVHAMHMGGRLDGLALLRNGHLLGNGFKKREKRLLVGFARGNSLADIRTSESVGKSQLSLTLPAETLPMPLVVEVTDDADGGGVIGCGGGVVELPVIPSPVGRVCTIPGPPTTHCHRPRPWRWSCHSHCRRECPHPPNSGRA